MGPRPGSGKRGCEAALILPERPHACATCRPGPIFTSIRSHVRSLGILGAPAQCATDIHPAQAEWTKATRAGSTPPNHVTPLILASDLAHSACSTPALVSTVSPSP